MARIRSIKPEFPQSESMGRVSRDARLLFVLLWPICDDHGRTRAASRMLASLLFPYDNDAPSQIDGWLSELQDENCIRLYEAEGSRYLEICNWLKHQKIDRPSQPLFPAFSEDSRILASPREPSCLDQGPRTKDQGEEKATVQPSAAQRRAAKDISYTEDFERFWKTYPNKQSKQDAMRHWLKHGLEGESEWLIDHVRMMCQQDDGWKRGYAPMGSTYLNGKRWEDVPRPTPRHQLSKSAQGFIALQEMKNGLDDSGNKNGFPEIDMPRLGSPARFGTFGGNGNGVG
jgi:hypothetical protein